MAVAWGSPLPAPAHPNNPLGDHGATRAPTPTSHITAQCRVFYLQHDPDNSSPKSEWCRLHLHFPLPFCQKWIIKQSQTRVECTLYAQKVSCVTLPCLASESSVVFFWFHTFGFLWLSLFSTVATVLQHLWAPCKSMSPCVRQFYFFTHSLRCCWKY